MTLLKDMIEDIINENEDSAKVNFHSFLTEKMKKLNEQWEKGDDYSYKEIKLSANPEIAIQGPVSYASFIKEFSTQEAEDIKGFVKGTWYVTYTRTNFKTNDFNNNIKVFKDVKSANSYKKELQEKLGK